MNFSLTEKNQQYIKKALNARLEVVNGSINTKQNELNDLNNEANEIRSILGQIENVHQTHEQSANQNEQPVLNGYPSDASWSKKAAYVIKKEGKALTTREVAERVSRIYEPTLERKAIVPKLSVALTTTKIFVKNERSNGDIEFSVN